MTPYIDYRLVPNSTDFAAVLADLQAVSTKFHVDGVAVAATFDIELDGDPKAKILAVSKKFNITVRRLEWGYREESPFSQAEWNARVAKACAREMPYGC